MLSLPRAAGGRTTCAEVARCAFGLAAPDLRAYDALALLGRASADDVAARVGRDATVVWRQLRRLESCGLVERHRRPLAGGGHRYDYEAVPKAEAKRLIEACIDDWHARMKAAVARL